MKLLSKTMILVAALFVLPIRVLAYEDKPFVVNATDPVYIHSEAEWWELWWAHDHHPGVNEYSKEIYLCADIEFNVHTPMRTTGRTTFTGKLHGQGHKMSHLVYNLEAYDDGKWGDKEPGDLNGNYYGSKVGLFGEIDGALIEDLYLDVGLIGGKDDIILGTSWVGVVAGKAKNSTIRNVTVSGCSGVLATDEECGGIVGYAKDCTITGCVNNLPYVHANGGFYGPKGEIIAFVGGIVGNGDGGTIQDCVNNSWIIGDDDFVGGIVGEVVGGGSLCRCINNGRVEMTKSGQENVGGIAGYASVGECINRGEVISQGDYVGGIVGECVFGVWNCINYGNVSGDEYVGGIAGRTYGKGSNLANYGNVTGSDDNVGGIIGSLYPSSTTVRDLISSYNAGAVIGDDCVGGIVGFLDGQILSYGCSIIGCVNQGPVSGDSDVGGIYGDKDSNCTIANCWDVTQVNSGHSALGLTGDPVSDGYICWLLDTRENTVAEEDRGQWTQCLGVDNVPIPAALNNHFSLYKVYGGYEHGGTAFALSNHQLHPAAHNAETNNHDACCVDGLCSVCGRMSGTLAEGVIKEGDVYLLSTANHLRWFADQVNKVDNTANAKLTADIDLDGVAWIPIGVYKEGSDRSFAGEFDGQGHTISNLSFDHTTGEYSGYDDYGLFGRIIAGGTVKNLMVKNASMTANGRCGVIAGDNVGGVISCVATLGTLAIDNGSNQKGSIMGEFFSGSLLRSYTTNYSETCPAYGLYTGPGTSVFTCEHSYWDFSEGDMLSNGKLCQLLNEGLQTTPVWGQNVASDERPVLTGEGVYYSRAVSAVGDIGTICLPFDGVLQGAQLYEISSLSTSAGNISEIEFTVARDPEAGKGYVFKATGTELMLRCTSDPVSAKSNNGLVGVIAAGKTAVPDGGYILKGGVLKRSGGSATVGTCKAYIAPSAYSAPSSSPSSMPRLAPSSVPTMVLTVEE